jgi:hypothetical protein
MENYSKRQQTLSPCKRNDSLREIKPLQRRKSNNEFLPELFNLT